jgi:hypothetical protein
MSAHNNLLYKLVFNLPNSTEFPFKEPGDLAIASRSLSPADAAVHPAALSIIESLARDYVYALGSEFRETMRATVRLSPEEGLEIIERTDERFSTIFKENSVDVGAVVKASAVESQGIGYLKQVEVSEDTRRQGESMSEEPVIFLDPISYILWERGIKGSFELDLEVQCRLMASEVGGLTTSVFRFPHIYQDMFKRYGDSAASSDMNVCIVGPGLDRPEKGIGSCPQFVELRALFPNANFLLLDNDAEAIKYLSQQYKTLKFAAYDPFMHRAMTADFSENTHLAPKKMQPVLKRMAEVWSQQSKRPEARQMLKGIGPIQPLLLNVDPDKVELREFDINTSVFKEEEARKFDVMVATMSILLALGENPEYPLDIFVKYLAALKKGGTFYVDAMVIENILSPRLSCDTCDSLASLFEKKLGGCLRFEKIALTSFLPEAVGNFSVIPQLNTNAVKGGHVDRNISTAAVFAITRLD